MTFDLKKIVRPKIYNLEPYRCARDDFTEGILLDANENSSGCIPASLKNTGLNRYPDPHQIELKKLFAGYRNRKDTTPNVQALTEKNLCLGVGSDECIDALIRACCKPGSDKILTLPPTYSMYSVCCEINDVETLKCPLIIDGNSFDLDYDSVLSILQKDSSIKLLFITSPGNPTGKLVDQRKIEKILQNWDTGLVVVDEAYIDFCTIDNQYKSMAKLVTKYPNLTVLQTFSKSFGLAGVRVGVTFASEEFATVLNAMKAPYNISSMASAYAIEASQDNSLKAMEDYAAGMAKERSRVLKALTSLKDVEDDYVGGLDANFIMVRIKGGDNELAKKLYLKLANESKVVVRFRGTELGCSGCLRITIGTSEENDVLIEEFEKSLSSLTQ